MTSLFYLYLVPLVSSLLLAMPLRFSEKFITRVSLFSLLMPTFATIIISYISFSSGNFPVEVMIGRVTIADHIFPFIAWLDINTLGLLGLTHILSLLVVKFSHGYLHLEKGYQRFFSTILFFIFGMLLLSLAGHMDLFFAGWEIVGFSSFLLIAFYRSHTRSVMNAWRVYNIYRVCDMGLLIGAVIGHVLWHEATRFGALSELSKSTILPLHSGSFFFLCLSLVFASLGKSAQFPFYNWPARAMEGPTPSSAIFYGALSIHAGVFLLIRTEALWSQSFFICLLIGLIGLITMILSSVQGRIQTNIKGQIAYASTSQIGLMFVELSLGLYKLVLIHLITHSLYRCFQLLVSPSVVAASSSLNNKLVFGKISQRRNWMDALPAKYRETLFVLGMNDFFMDISWRGFPFFPWKAMYRIIRNISGNKLFIYSFTGIVLFSLLMNSNKAYVLALAGVFFSFRSIFLHQNPFRMMADLTTSLIFCSLSAYTLEPHSFASVITYLTPVMPSLIIGLVMMWNFRDKVLITFHGLGTAHPFQANLFMVCFLILSGMPVTTAFVGEDMLLEELLKHSATVTAMVSFCLMTSGLVCVKIYSRLFMGRPHI